MAVILQKAVIPGRIDQFKNDFDRYFMKLQMLFCEIFSSLKLFFISFHVHHAIQMKIRQQLQNHFYQSEVYASPMLLHPPAILFL